MKHIRWLIPVLIVLLPVLASAASPGVEQPPTSTRSVQLRWLPTDRPATAPQSPAYQNGFFPGLTAKLRMEWSNDNLTDTPLNFTAELSYPYPYIEYHAAGGFTPGDYVSGCTHDAAAHKFTCTGTFPASNPTQYLTAWADITFIGRPELYGPPQPSTINFSAALNYSDGTSSTANLAVEVEPVTDLTVQADTPLNAAVEVKIEAGGLGPLLSWSHAYTPGHSQPVCANTTPIDPLTQDIVYAAQIRPVGGAWQTIGSGANCAKQIQLPATFLECDANGDPLTYEWRITTGDVRYYQQGAIKENVFRFQTASCRPALEVQPEYGVAPGYFLNHLTVDNRFKALVDWNGPAYETPDTAAPFGDVLFNLNGGESQVIGAQWGAERAYNMGSDFQASLQCANNTLRVQAVYPAPNGRTYRSLDTTLQPTVFTFPGWVDWLETLGLGSFKTTLKAPIVEYAYQFTYPAEPFAANWTPPAWVPYIGGHRLGIIETQAGVQALGRSNGVGQGRVTGQTGLDLGMMQLVGSLYGQGDVALTCGRSLDLKQAELGFTVRNTAEVSIGLADLFPPLRAAEKWPVVGRIIRWVNSVAQVKSTMTPELNIVTRFAPQDGQLKFVDGTGRYSFDQRLTLATEICEDLNAEVYGGGRPNFTVQVPKNPGYFKSVGIELYLGASFKAWRFETSVERRIACNYPGACEDVDAEDAATRLSARNDAPQWRLIPRPEDLAGASRNLSGLASTVLLTNIYPRPEPALAVRADGRRLLAYIEADPAKPIGHDTEVHVLASDGVTWAAPISLTDDQQLDFHPAVAFDGAGNGVVVWERSTLPIEITPTLDITFARSLDLVARAWLSSTQTWSGVITLTNNALMDHAPRLAAGIDGAIWALWQTNDGEDILGTAAHPITLTTALWTGAAWSAPAPALTGLQDVTSIAFAAYSATQAALVYARDLDGDPGTLADTELYQSAWNGAAWSAPARITTDTFTDTRPSLAYNAAGNLHLIWQRGQNVVWLNNSWIAANAQPIISGSEAGLLGLSVHAAPNGQLALTWQAMSDAGADLAYAIYDAAANQWSAPLALTHDSLVEADTTAAFGSDGALNLAYRSSVTQFVTKTIVLSPTLTITAVNVPQAGPSDLVFLAHTVGRDLALDSLTITPGTPSSLTAQLRNAGDLAVASPQVAFYDGAAPISTVTLNLTLTAGMTTSVPLAWTLPTPVVSHTLRAVADPNHLIVETDETNNTAQLITALPDLVIDWATTQWTTEALSITARLRNAGVSATTRPFSLTVRADDPITGTLLAQVAVPQTLAPDQAITLTLGVANPIRLWQGARTGWLTIDAGATISEADEDNNVTSINLDALPDLALTADDLQAGASYTVTIHNTGVLTAVQPGVAVWLNGLTGTLLYSGTLRDLGPGAGGTLTFAPPPAATVSLWIKVDPADTIPETDESNNLAVRAGESLCVAATGVTLNGPLTGAAVAAQTFTATILPAAATQPITYTWHVDGLAQATRAGGANDVFSKTWSSEGPHAISVTTAQRCGSSLAASQPITIGPRRWPYTLRLPLMLKNYAPPPPPPTSDRYVKLNGLNTGTCATPAAACASIQRAIDQARPGDRIGIAGYATAAGDSHYRYGQLEQRAAPAGYYGPATVRQVAYISQTVTLLGGYSADFGSWSPLAYPTMIDGQGQGRGIFVAPGVTATLSYLHIVSGTALNQGGLYASGGSYDDAGGGVYALGMPTYQGGRDMLTLDHCTLAYNAGQVDGGGAYIHYRPGAQVVNNSLQYNSAGRGGGLNVNDSANAVISGNDIGFNTASVWGGGLLLIWGNGAQVSNNRVHDNTASRSSAGFEVRFSDNVSIVGNTVERNAVTGGDGVGGGATLFFINNLLALANTFDANTITPIGPSGIGGGLYLTDVSGGTLAGNTFINNVASANLTVGTGGGLSLYNTQNVNVSGNVILGNVASATSTDPLSVGGGVRVAFNSTAITFTNNIIARNQAAYGGGLALVGRENYPVDVTLQHTTLADNTSVAGLPAQGLLAYPYLDAAGVRVTARAVNTIVSGHARGMSSTWPLSSSIAFNYTLWNNTINYGVETAHTHDLTGDPLFVNAAGGDYHLTASSPAKDTGLNAGVAVDIDGQARPQFAGYDLGADEYAAANTALIRGRLASDGIAAARWFRWFNWLGCDPAQCPAAAETNRLR